MLPGVLAEPGNTCRFSPFLALTRYFRRICFGFYSRYDMVRQTMLEYETKEVFILERAPWVKQKSAIQVQVPSWLHGLFYSECENRGLKAAPLFRRVLIEYMKQFLDERDCGFVVDGEKVKPSGYEDFIQKCVKEYRQSL